MYIRVDTETEKPEITDLTPHEAEGPVVECVVGGREGDAEDDEQEVGHGQVEDQHVRRVSHRLKFNQQQRLS